MPETPTTMMDTMSITTTPIRTMPIPGAPAASAGAATQSHIRKPERPRRRAMEAPRPSFMRAPGRHPTPARRTSSSSTGATEGGEWNMTLKDYAPYHSVRLSCWQAGMDARPVFLFLFFFLLLRGSRCYSQIRARRPCRERLGYLRMYRLVTTRLLYDEHDYMGYWARRKRKRLIELLGLKMFLI